MNRILILVDFFKNQLKVVSRTGFLNNNVNWKVIVKARDYSNGIKNKKYVFYK